MEQLKRIKVRESIDLWNKKHSTKNKKTALTISKNIGIDNRNLSLWNKEAPKQVKSLYELSKILNCRIYDLYVFDEKDDLVSLRISEILKETEYTFTTLSYEIMNSSESRLRLWDQGKLPFSIVNFFNFCRELKVNPDSILEY